MARAARAARAALCGSRSAAKVAATARVFIFNLMPPSVPTEGWCALANDPLKLGQRKNYLPEVSESRGTYLSFEVV